MATVKTKAQFVKPMLLLRTSRLPESQNLQYEVKLDGFRAIAFKSGGKVHLRSRNNKDFNSRYPAIVKALSAMPDETMIDGEVVALDAIRAAVVQRATEPRLLDHADSVLPV